MGPGNSLPSYLAVTVACCSAALLLSLLMTESGGSTLRKSHSSLRGGITAQSKSCTADFKLLLLPSRKDRGCPHGIQLGGA